MLGLAFTIIFGALAIHFGYLVREHGWREGLRQWRSGNSPLLIALSKGAATGAMLAARAAPTSSSSAEGGEAHNFDSLLEQDLRIDQQQAMQDMEREVNWPK